jgi:SAM-dependent methyltransferase
MGLRIDAPTAADLHERALAAFEAGRPDDAAGLLRSAVAAELDMERLNDLAVVCTALGRTADAESLLKAALVIDPERTDAAENLAALREIDARDASAPRAAGPTDVKGRSELSYWEGRKRREGTFVNAHYEFLFADHFGLAHDFFAGKRIVDIGCGPRGSLEWAHMAAQRVGVDPLAESYLELGADEHEMEYVASGAEHIPFADGHFDIVTTINSLDHVDDLGATITELKRVLRPGGTLLLLTDVNHDPNPCEPHDFSWDIVDEFTDQLRAVDVRHFERNRKGMLECLQTPTPYDHERAGRRAGIISVRFVKE